MKLLYLDCSAGASGDMFVAALLDLGVSLSKIKRELAKLPLQGCRISAARGKSKGISGTRFCVSAQRSHRHHDHDHSDFAAIQRMLATSRLDAEVKRRTISVFLRIAKAEGKIHGLKPERVHFHEVGAIDSIADIVSACVAIKELGVEKILASSPLVVGSGLVDCEHGRLPVPAPATLEILRGVELTSGDEQTELLTPTGAALLREFCEGFLPMPPLRVMKAGYGLGTKELVKTPNVLRAILGEWGGSRDPSGTQTDEVCILETNLDDMNPQFLGEAMEQLLLAGALDVFFVAAQMKKNRPGQLLTVLCEPSRADALAKWILTHTTSFGVRRSLARRQTLAREIVRAKTKWGPVNLKIGRLDQQIVSVSPEFESCRRLARARKLPLKRVFNAALRKAEEFYG